MADLQGGGGGPQTSNGNGTSSSRRPTAAPAPTSSPSGIRGPRIIMQERAAREAARQRAEQEQMQMERNRAEQEARLLEEAQRRNAERRAAAAAAAGAAAGGQGGGNDKPQVDPTQRRTGGTDAPQARPAQGSSRAPQAPPTQTQQTRPARTAASQPQRQDYANIPQTGSSQQPPNLGTQSGETAAGGGARARNSFPHAFERWETLSAHWEGLTNFWIRRLEQNNDEIARDPVNSALSRQVTDLSAAGANLFHAVVELQRLRASSERKFQRWFFETRAELERAQEVNAMLETALDEERRARATAMRAANDGQNSLNAKRLVEAQKELQISKEEARRAWEELGRREQEERERTISLQTGQPTIVGGVQVVPMTQGVPSRHTSNREQPRYEPGSQQSGYSDYTQAPAVQPTTSTSSGGGRFYQQPGETLHEGVSYTAGGSEGGYSEDDYETPATHPPSAGYSQPPNSSASGQYYQQQPQQPSGQAQGQTPDYSGQDYAAPGWETVPRHHHPTRLSDVIEEEDERSRTSASQVSRG